MTVSRYAERLGSEQGAPACRPDDIGVIQPELRRAAILVEPEEAGAGNRRATIVGEQARRRWRRRGRDGRVCNLCGRRRLLRGGPRRRRRSPGGGRRLLRGGLRSRGLARGGGRRALRTLWLVRAAVGQQQEGNIVPPEIDR